MIEQLVFIITSVILFGIIFFKMIQKNETSYIPILALQALGILADGLFIVLELNFTIFLKIVIMTLSILLPIVIIILEHFKIDLINGIKFLKVKFYIKNGNLKNAKDILITLVEKNPNNYKAHKYLASIYEKEGGIRKAIDEYVKCIDIDKKDYDSYYKVAIFLNGLDRKNEAIQMLTDLLDKKGDYYQASITLGDLLIEQQNYKEATLILQDALKFNPENFDLNYYLGMTYTLLNDFQNAKRCYEKAADINHQKYITKYSLAELALLYKDLDMAERFFEESIEDKDLQADSYYELSKIKLMKGSKDLAIKYANIAIDINAKKISEKIKKEPLFIPILSKISIPFNIEENEEECSLTQNEIKTKEHLEKTSVITANMGYMNMQGGNEKTYDNGIKKDKEI